MMVPVQVGNRILNVAFFPLFRWRIYKHPTQTDKFTSPRTRLDDFSQSVLPCVTSTQVGKPRPPEAAGSLFWLLTLSFDCLENVVCFLPAINMIVFENTLPSWGFFSCGFILSGSVSVRLVHTAGGGGLPRRVVALGRRTRK